MDRSITLCIRNRISSPFISVSKFLGPRIEGEYVPKSGKGRQTRSWGHVPEFVDNHHVMQKEEKKKKQEDITKGEKIVNRGKQRRRHFK